MSTAVVVAVLLSLPPAAARAGAPPPFAGVVVRAVDGDTVDVLTEFGPVVRVRLVGVDCPELHHPLRPVQYGAIEAWAHTAGRLTGRRVRVTGDAVSGRDPYGRALGYVWVGRRLFNRELIDLGLGYLEGQYAFARLRSFARAEALARLARRGLWGR